LLIFAQQKELAALEVTAYNPAKDPDASGAKLIVDLLAEALGARLAALKSPEAAVAAPSAAVAAAASQGSGGPSSSKDAAPEPELELPAASAGEAWSYESIEEASDLAPDSDSSDDDSGESAGSEESSGSHS
jgi:hypothetical protein